jgi:hypothetical protein
MPLLKIESKDEAMKMNAAGCCCCRYDGVYIKEMSFTQNAAFGCRKERERETRKIICTAWVDKRDEEDDDDVNNQLTLALSFHKSPCVRFTNV